MKKIINLFLTVLIFASCKKDITPPAAAEVVQKVTPVANIAAGEANVFRTVFH
jgi:hypothetical protein